MVRCSPTRPSAPFAFYWRAQCLAIYWLQVLRTVAAGMYGRANIKTVLLPAERFELRSTVFILGAFLQQSVLWQTTYTKPSHRK